MNHSHQALGYADILYRASNRVSVKNNNFYQGNVGKELRKLNSKYTSEKIFRLWVNKDNITRAALSALLVTEAIAALPTFGGSLSAMPYTAAALAAVSLTAKTVLISNSAANIVDRYNFDGVNGLLNFETAVDALIVVTLLPRIPLMGNATAPSYSAVQGTLGAKSLAVLSNMAKFSRYMMATSGRYLNNALAQFQYSSGTLLAWGAGGYGVYQFSFADSIAEDLQSRGININASTIRKRATFNIAMSLLTFAGNKNFIRRNLKQQPAVTEQFMAKNSISNSFLVNRLKGAVNPLGAAKNFYSNSNMAWPIKGLGAASVFSGYVAYDFFVLSEVTLLSYTNTDGRYMNQIFKKDPLPELKEGESALNLVGFDKEDALLYLGSHAKASHRREMKHFGEKNFYIEDYDSPEHFLELIEKHAEKHGPIKYLKIMTHGKPGTLYTKQAMVGQAVATNSEEDNEKSLVLDPADQGWINGYWFEKYAKEIKKISKKAFAPDARIVVFACLVGANLDYLSEEEMPTENDPWYEYDRKLKIGDYFVDQMGDKLLVNGGLINTSTRILVGLDSSYGSAIRTAADNGNLLESKRNIIPLIDLERPMGASERPLKVKDLDEIIANSSITAVNDRMMYLTHKKESEESKEIAAFDSRPDIWAETNSIAGSLAENGLIGSAMASNGEPTFVEKAAYIGNRLKNIIPALPKLISKYGIQLEGPWWQSRYKSKSFAPQKL